jgi:hypothetical protein
VEEVNYDLILRNLIPSSVGGKAGGREDGKEDGKEMP